jgi:hypothetical protein
MTVTIWALVREFQGVNWVGVTPEIAPIEVRAATNFCG